MATITKTVERLLKSKNCKFQFMHQAVSRVRIRGKKGQEYTELTMATNAGFTPKDAMFPNDSNFVGIIIWAPTSEYKKARG